MTKTLITIPMKPPAASKTRLAGTLDEAARERLTRLLYRRTLSFLGPICAQTGAELAVVTSSVDAAEIARAAEATVIEEPAENSDLCTAANVAAEYATANGFARLCLIPADLVAPEEGDVLKLLESTAAVTICPATDMGTNALLVSPPDAIRFCYGPRSAALHLGAAQHRGLSAVMMPLESLSFDLDTADGLARAIKAAPDLATGISA